MNASNFWTFWTLISHVDVAALNSGNETAAVQPLIEQLAELQVSEIENFADSLATHLYLLDGQVYADNAGESGKSSDGFLYARCFVIASGKSFYERVLANPSKFPSSIDAWCESLLYVAQRAWSEVAGLPMENWNYRASVSYETGSNEEKWK